MSSIIIKVSFNRVERNEIELKHVIKVRYLYQYLKLSTTYLLANFHTKENYLWEHHKIGARDRYRIWYDIWQWCELASIVVLVVQCLWNLQRFPPRMMLMFSVKIIGCQLSSKTYYSCYFLSRLWGSPNYASTYSQI